MIPFTEEFFNDNETDRAYNAYVDECLELGLDPSDFGSILELESKRWNFEPIDATVLESYERMEEF